MTQSFKLFNKRSDRNLFVEREGLEEIFEDKRGGGEGPRVLLMVIAYRTFMILLHYGRMKEIDFLKAIRSMKVNIASLS